MPEAVRSSGSETPTRRVALLKSPWKEAFHELVSRADEDLILASPFIKTGPAAEVISTLNARGLQDAIRVQLITNLRPESALTGSLDLEALAEMQKRLPKLELTHLPSLHAKVYVADCYVAVVTSGNLTDPGISGNLEYGVTLTDQATVAEVRRDFEAYAQLGARIPPTDIQELLVQMAELKQVYKKAERSIRDQARRAFRAKLRATNLRVLRQRAKGKTTHAILAETIIFILSRGPLTTAQLHPLVKSLQPDICDDTIDRVIDGVHFGKRWKHYVRTAQQHLKRQGLIRYDGERWHLVGPTAG